MYGKVIQLYIYKHTVFHILFNYGLLVSCAIK